MADNEINVPVNIPDEEPELEVTMEAGEVVQVPLDESLTVHGMGADAKAVGERMRAAESNIEGLLASDAEKVQRPATNPNGTDGQLLRTHGDGNTEWVDEGLPTDEQTGAAVSAWLNEHPEATTTVQDGSITFVKLHPELQNIIGGLQNLSDAQQASIALMLAAMEGMVNGGFVENNALYLTHDGVVVAGPFEGIGGGGSGGGDSNTAKMSMTNGMEWLSTTIRKDAALPVTVNWSSTLDDIPTGNGSLKVQVNGTIKTILNVTQGAVTVDIGPYMSAGNNTVRLTISDAYGNTRSIVYTVNSVQIAISSSFDAAAAYNDVISFPYTPVGAVEKTVHFKLDGAEIGTVTTTISNRQLSYAIPAQDHGGHSLEVWFTAQINGETVESNRLYYEFVALEDGNDTPIIISGFAADEVTQYDTVNIPFQVYDPAGMEAEVEIYEGDTLKTTVTVGRAGTSYTYRADKAGSASVKFKTGETVKTVSFNVTALNIDVHAETEGLLLHLNAQGRSNAEANPATWEDGETAAVFSGFNWTSDGWQRDENGADVLRVSGDARVVIPFEIFAQDFRTEGRTIEIEFATRNTRDYDAQVLSCFSGGRGFALTAQTAMLASEQSAVAMQYKEDEHVRISFVVQKRSEQRLILCYINGIASGATPYPENDDFSQVEPVGITLGGSASTLDVYSIRVYDHDLTRFQMKDNWIADTQNGAEMLARYRRNNVYDEYGNIVISKLPDDLPYLILEGVLPTFKGNKLIISGSYVDPVHPEKSFTFENAQIDVQGTSSQYYARKNYKIKFSDGFVIDGKSTSKYAMNDDAVPTKTFTMKADVASSEGANNVELARLYNDACPYKTPYQRENKKIRQGIDGFPIVIFHNDGENTTFLGKYNFNNDKGTEEVFGFQAGDESWEIRNNTSLRVLWKSDDYTSMGVDDKGNPIPAWLNDFEARFPEDNTNPANLAALAEWLKSTDQAQATGDALPDAVTYTDGEGESAVSTTYENDTAAYRLAKFRHELSDHMEVQAILFYYLFTELFLMVDSRAKNAFPTKMGSDKWFIMPYDFDTALGINNEGALAFSYNLEDTDHMESGADIFNGQESVLWVNLRQAFYAELKAMYQDLRSRGALSYSKVEGMFEAHQGKWPEAVFNEDAQFKYIDPLIEDGDGSYLKMLQGSKTEQRKWWLYNRFRYIDSKYNAGDALTDVVQLRGYANANITVIPYADIYPAVKYGSYLVTERGRRNNPTTLVNPLDNTNDTEIYIYSCSQLASVGDISGLKVGFADFSKAVKLQTLKIGDSSEEYSNGNLTELYLGNNTLLRVLDVRNCPALVMSVDLRGCKNLEEAYFEGTSVTGVQVPDGGVLRVLHLPNTITNLTILNQTRITDLVAPMAGLTTMRLENVPTIDTKAMLNACPANTRVRLVGFSWEAENAAEIEALLDKLDTMRGLDENGNNMEKAQVSGTIHTDSLSGAEVASYNARYPYLRILADHISCVVTYKTFDGSSVIDTETVLDGGDAVYSGRPSRSSTAQYDFTFAGWATSPNGSANSNAQKEITADKTLYAAYTGTLRTYTAYFARSANDGGGTLYTQNNVPYGSTPVYGGETPTTTQGDAATYPFKGWSPSLGPITGNTTYYALFGSPVEVKEITDTWEEIFAAIDNGTYAAKYAVGNYVALDLGTEGAVYAQIVAMNADPLADGSGNAPITWITKYLCNTDKRMNPYVEEVYKYPEVPSWTASGNTWTSQNRYITSTAKATWTITATADGTFTVNYKTSNSNASGNKITSLTVNGASVATNYTNTTGATHEMNVTAGDTVTVYAEYDLVGTYSYYATITFGGTATFSVAADVQNAQTRKHDYYKEGTGAVGGWVKTEMRQYLRETLIQKFPEIVRNRIKAVKKYTRDIDQDGNQVNNVESTETLWLPSMREVYNSAETAGPTYTALFKDAETRKKYKPGASSAVWWWLRSGDTSTRFSNITSDGNNYNNNANNAGGVACGFCT